MEVTRIFDLLPHYKSRFQHKEDAIAGKEDGRWVKYNIDQYIEMSDNISYGLIKLGVRTGDKVASISTNRPEWNFIDMGIMQIGAVHVPIYPTISESDYQHILKHSGVKFVFVCCTDLLRKIEHLVPEIESIKGLYTFDFIENVRNLSELVELGKSNPVPDQLNEIRASIKPDDLATLIYTSGTTGVPKGVMLTHRNILSNVFDTWHIFPLNETHKGVSYLPLCHVYERTNIYVYQYLGVSLYYAENLGTIADNLKEIKPEVLTTVPRLLEKVYDKILARGSKLKGIKKTLFFRAVKLANNYELNGKNIFYKMKLAVADKLVFKKWRDGLGGNLRVVVSGGAALQPRLSRIFTAAGIPVLQGYGLTETSPVIAVNTFEKDGRKFGTVGKPLKSVTVKIAGDGEILCKGPNVMQGYYKEPELTAQTIDSEGWLHTGDIGRMNESGQLIITGRKKEIFKTSLGKYISPQTIETRFKESLFIDALIVVGENQKYAAALLVPDFNHLRSWSAGKQINYVSDDEMVSHPEVKKQFKKEVDHFNASLGNTEKIMRFRILDREWTIDGGELTASLKLKRTFIQEKYKEEIEALFS
jgi:long-chain acyl-CoA synthetase